MRLFVAVRPPEPVLIHLDLALRTVAAAVDTGDRSSPVRWTEVENRHLTVAFFGDVADSLVGELGDAVAAAVAEAHPFELHLRGAGVFAHRTLWVGVGGDVVAMRQLSDAVGRAGSDLVARSDDRVRSRPHLTVGRVDPSIRRSRSRWTGQAQAEDPAEALVRALAVYEGPSWLVEDVLLLASQPGAGRGGGPLYSTVRTHTFRAM
ncbi:RNA 2',3'-cyclic phosphodiesterase [Cellulomonas sp. WB94]|uniref:RNA 2',3'-cyclic phosphodiesterase n=1 Tax=Cellulomonas sp. WB94 TaxID=2173174 RepID=UPI000D56A426|nr:RNA 2',3'-cyclic phosphodiesterase [Cellulomonas sp. WB94]PVU81587.1 RNA 2',3'-cyclic phosphodiesterase [Cellulomonas sp. WB94]